jgi:hypothetical protein
MIDQTLIPKDRKCCRCESNKTSVGSDGVAKWSVVDRPKVLPFSRKDLK